MDAIRQLFHSPSGIRSTFERRHSAELSKGFPSRVELISAGPVGSSRTVYFVEWRALSQSVGGDGRLVDRSGRFEDLFLRLPVSSRGDWSVSVGQFRTLTQVDVSQRLSLSEPLVFSSSVPGRRASDARLTGLRAFSASGLYGNGHLPFGPSAFRQALRLQIEHRIQPANHVTGFALSHVF